jgi:hypothetical protein
MPTDTKEFSSRRKAFVAEALMIRAEHAYRGTRDNAKTLGVDLSADPDTQSFAVLSQRYDNLLQEWATETPITHGEMLAYLELVDAIVDGERLTNRSDEFVGPASSERDLDYALTLLTSLRREINKKDIADYIAEVEARS